MGFDGRCDSVYKDECNGFVICDVCGLWKDRIKIFCYDNILDEEG